MLVREEEKEVGVVAPPLSPRPMPAQEVEHVLVREEEKEVGVVALSVYRSYWLAVGSCLAPLILTALFLMQGGCGRPFLCFLMQGGCGRLFLCFLTSMLGSRAANPVHIWRSLCLVSKPLLVHVIMQALLIRYTPTNKQ